MVDFVLRRALREKADRSAFERLQEQVAQLSAVVTKLAAAVPRKAQFTLTNIATGTATTQDVSWNVPIAGDYSIDWSVTCAAAAVGLLTAGVQAGSKTPTGCALIIANRTGVVIGTAAFDVLAFPL